MHICTHTYLRCVVQRYIIDNPNCKEDESSKKGIESSLKKITKNMNCDQSENHKNKTETGLPPLNV